MSDTTLNRFLARGSTAARLAFTPSPPTPASGPDSGYFWWDEDLAAGYAWDGAAWAPLGSGLPAPGNLGDVLTLGSGLVPVWDAPSGGSGTSIPVNSQSADYTLVLGDAGKMIYHPTTDASLRTWTIPANASVAFDIGTPITFDNDAGAGSITIAITSDTLVQVGTGATGSRTLSAGGRACAIKVTATRWRIEGTGLS